MAGFDIAHLERRIAALEANRGASLRFGKVTGVEGGYARVQLADGHGMVSMPLATLHRRVLRDQDITMPDQGEPVAVLFSGQGLEAGVVLGAVYSPAVPDPAQDAHIDYRRYEDGTELWYDRIQHKLIANVRGSVSLKAEKDISVESLTRISLKAPSIELAGNLIQTGYSGGAATSELQGSFTVLNGGITVPDNDIVAGSVSVRSHVHDNVRSGSDTSGSPVGG